ncbi:MAG: family 1 encapsulin nanocompartment shell protein [Bacteroidales bacterium]
MDFLKRELAPISAAGWELIDARATEVIKANLSARRFVSVKGPLGKNTEAIGTGKMELSSLADVPFGVYKVKPLVEQRINFTMNRWELDNIERGAKDVNTFSLDEAVKKAARFEETVIYGGLVEADITGLSKSTAHKTLSFGTTYEETMGSLMKAISMLKNSYAPSPYALVLSPQKWAHLNMIGKDSEFVKNLTNGFKLTIVVSNFIDNAYLLPIDNENFELSIGQDFSIGYQSANGKEVELYVTSSFTFRVLDPTMLIVFEK